jgi:hypothetical protein
MWGQKGLFPFRSKGNGECAVCPRFIPPDLFVPDLFRFISDDSR